MKVSVEESRVFFQRARAQSLSVSSRTKRRSSRPTCSKGGILFHAELEAVSPTNGSDI